MRFSNPPEALDCCGDPQLFVWIRLNSELRYYHSAH
jgi:hypothetical protein